MASRAPDRKKKLDMTLPRVVRVDDKTYFEGKVSVDEVTAASIRKELRRSRAVRPYIEDTVIVTDDEVDEEVDAAEEGKPAEHL